MVLNEKQLDTVRQWFNHVEDTNPRYLNGTDCRLYIDIMNELGLRVPKRTKARSAEQLAADFSEEI